MEKLIQYQTVLLKELQQDFVRYPFETIPWGERFVGIKGLRGVGKTTMLLQHLQKHLGVSGEHLYVTLDHPYFYKNSLYELAEDFYNSGGKTLLVDEVHKMDNWSQQLKIVYDGFPGLQVVFTASSALNIYKGAADLSRRVLEYNLSGLSFREYLGFAHQIFQNPISLSDLLENHLQISMEIGSKCKPLPLFKQYLKTGYFPFGKGMHDDLFQARLIRTLEVVLNEDLVYVEGYNSDNIFKIKQLLAVIAGTAPFTINVTQVADKLGIGRNTVKAFMFALEKAGLINYLTRSGKGLSALQKPDKVYLDNTNFSYLLQTNPNSGSLRETFLVNQLKNAGFEITMPADGDVEIKLPDGNTIIEIGGKSKNAKQVKHLPDFFIAADEIETGFKHKIPLYLFGFLY
jgi:predicted AAA+ superfamily ATPase